MNSFLDGEDNWTRCRDNFRMPKEAFIHLLNFFIHVGLGKFIFGCYDYYCSCIIYCTDNKRVRRISREIKVALFVEWLGQGYTERQQAEAWQISCESVFKSRQICIWMWYNYGYSQFVHFSLPDIKYNEMLADSKYSFFHGMKWALDGTHIAVNVNKNVQKVFRNRHNYTSTNVLLVCNHDLFITYAYVGVEGCAHDGFVLQEAITKGNLTFSDDTYFAVDGGYALKYKKYCC